MRRLLSLALPLLPLSTVTGDEIDFARDVQPILSENCYACHGPDEAERAADLRLDTPEGAYAALTVGDPLDSDLIYRIMAEDPDDLMPPPDKKSHLTDAQVATLSQWIEEGAKWGRHWAFDPPIRPEVPETEVGHPIDWFVSEKLLENDLEPSDRADRATLLRRLSLDLTGLPPTLKELDDFLQDESEKAYGKAVERLLASPHYGERWARWWMDGARYADSNGYERDTVRSVWPYRDWMIDSFNTDLPYDQFIIKQIGGDLLENPTLDDRVATGFLRNSMVNEEGAIDAEQFRIEGIVDRMDAVGKSVLGLTLQCAQCHTHKYDPITHDEYYGIFAYLNNSHEATVPFYTKAQQAEIEATEARLEDVRTKARSAVSDWEANFQAWIARTREEMASEPNWTQVTPELLGDGGQKFYPMNDGSLIARGFNPSSCRERFQGETELSTIRSLRIELIQDPYMTYGGPGRSLEGGAAISEIKLLLGPNADSLNEIELQPAVSDLDQSERPTDTIKWPIKDPEADDTRTEGPASFATDGNGKTAWITEAGAERTNQPRELVINLKEPFTRNQALTYQFHLQSSHGGWNSDDNHGRNVGRFRLSFSDQAFPDHQPTSPLVKEILAIPRAEWTKAQHDRVLEAWMEDEPAVSEWYAALNHEWENRPQPTPQLALKEREIPRETRLFERGEQTHPKHIVKPHVPAFIHDLPEGRDPESRLTFAHWLVDRDSPTAARTLVNRVWAEFFGTGIVESVEDLGHQATRPSHPKLLDWLAVEFMESGWEIKPLLRLIVTSAAYQQRSDASESLLELDPNNRLLARGPRFRPAAEVVRDIQLAVSGLLDRSVGGKSARPPIPEFLFLPPVSYGPKTWNVDTAPEKRYRRAIYTFRFRTVPPPFLAAFDAPSGEISCTRRPRSTTPLQALALLNEPLSMEAAEGLAKSMASTSGDLVDRIERAFRQCTSRRPEADEIEVLVRLHDSEKAVGADPFLAIARVLLNLDETITKS